MTTQPAVWVLILRDTRADVRHPGATEPNIQTVARGEVRQLVADSVDELIANGAAVITVAPRDMARPPATKPVR